MVEPNPGKVVWTYDDLQRMPEDGNRYEVVDGELLVTPSPGAPHQRVSKRIQHRLMTLLEDTGVAEVFDAPFDLILGKTRCVIPDLIVIRAGRDIVTRRGVEGVPDLVVEILSPGSIDHDREIKFKLYASISVPEYWIVDPAARTIEVYALADGALALRATYGAGETLRSVGFAEVALPLDVIFAAPL